jgi:hypothetical protein
LNLPQVSNLDEQIHCRALIAVQMKMQMKMQMKTMIELFGKEKVVSDDSTLILDSDSND